MDPCSECIRLQEEIRNRTQARVVAENSLVLSGASVQLSKSRAVDVANREWMHAVLEYQHHMQAQHARDK
jgi:hypothetical protein